MKNLLKNLFKIPIAILGCIAGLVLWFVLASPVIIIAPIAIFLGEHPGIRFILILVIFISFILYIDKKSRKDLEGSLKGLMMQIKDLNRRVQELERKE